MTYQGRGPRIDKLMLRACGYDDQVAGFHILVLARDSGATYAGREGKDLVDGMYLELALRLW